MKKPGIRTNKTNYRNGAGFISAPFKKNTGLKNSAGLTLIELLVVVAIMMIMAAIVIVNYRPGNQQLALNRSASKLAQDIRRAQEMAMSSAEVGGSVPRGIGVVMVKGGPDVGIEITNRKYHLYADIDNTDGYNKYNDGLDELISTVDLSENGIFIDSILIPGTPDADMRYYINFIPPDPEINIFKRTGDASGDTHLGTEITITLALESDPSKTKTVRVNSAGLIYVE